MIKFFRKIRQDLVSKGNTGKYLKYALGEIALVVIGILIALGINNWNQEKNNVAQARKHLQTILLNLKDDVAQAEDLMRETQTTFEFTNTLLGQFKTLLPVDNNMQMD